MSEMVERVAIAIESARNEFFERGGKGCGSISEFQARYRLAGSGRRTDQSGSGLRLPGHDRRGAPMTDPDPKVAARKIADVKRLRVNDFEEKAIAAFSDKLTDRKQRDAYRAIQALARMARGEE
jgi:hypothetical protein